MATGVVIYAANIFFKAGLMKWTLGDRRSVVELGGWLDHWTKGGKKESGYGGLQGFMIPFLLSHLRFSLSLKGDDGSFFGQGRLGDFFVTNFIFSYATGFLDRSNDYKTATTTTTHLCTFLACLFSPSIALHIPLLVMVLPRPSSSAFSSRFVSSALLFLS